MQGAPSLRSVISSRLQSGKVLLLAYSCSEQTKQFILKNVFFCLTYNGICDTSVYDFFPPVASVVVVDDAASTTKLPT